MTGRPQCVIQRQCNRTRDFRRGWGMIATILCLAAFVHAQTMPRVRALRTYDGEKTPSTNCNGNPCDINYNGGPVFEKGPTVYIIWYGDWTRKDKSIIDYYFSNLSGTTQEQINTTYSDSTGRFIPNAVNHNSNTDDYHDNYSIGKYVNASGIEEILAHAIDGGHLPKDTNGIYFVLTYKDVLDPAGFCTSWCGYHTPAKLKGDVIKYAMVGDPEQCPSSCETSYILGDKGSPNNDPGADGTTAIMWHEFSESSSDPEVSLNTAWAGNFCGEAADCCAWLFGDVKRDSRGHLYTNIIGTKEYAMQEMLQLTSKSRNGNVSGECENVYSKGKKEHE
jgi:hypothetical protein